MSKKKTQTKKATFTLEYDGFSIHTFELSRRITPRKYYSMRDRLYRLQEDSVKRGWLYRDNYGNHICTLYAEHGIRSIIFEQNQKAETYFVRIIVNPRKLIEQECSYIGILPPEGFSVKMLEEAFRELFEDTVFDVDLNSYQLTRLDLCTNIRCDNKKLFRELVRVLRKLPTPPKYERKKYKHKDKKKANRYNKHYLRFHCGTHELVIYDKTYQVRNNDLVVSYENLPEGVLRFEVHCERAYLREVEKKSGVTATDALLWLMIQESEERITSHFARCFSDVRFARTKELERIIKRSAFKKESKDVMLQLVTRLQRTQSVDKALEKLKKDGYDTSGVLDRFDKLGVSPIPLRKNFCAKELPGPVELLRGVSGGKITVDYLKVKYK